MGKRYGVAIRKGGQAKSTTVATLARLCAVYGARVLVVDLAQPGTATASLRDIWPDAAAVGDLTSAMLALRGAPAGTAPAPKQARAALDAAGLPMALATKASWGGGLVRVLPWDERAGDAAAYLLSERVLAALIDAAPDTDIVLIDYPAESGALLTNALVATDSVIVPLVPETPALEGLDALLRLMARVRESGHVIELGGILLTRCDTKNSPKFKRVLDIVQTLLGADIEGEPLGRKLYPFAIKESEYFEQAFRYGEPVWERTRNEADWAGYVLLAEWILRDAGLGHLLDAARRGPTILPPATRILDTSALMLDDPEVRLADFTEAHRSLVP